MRKLKKILSVILAVCSVFLMVSVSALAATTDIEAGNSMSKATKIPSYGVDYVSSLSKAGEQDWFKFTTKSNEAFYTISFKNYNIPTGGFLEEQLFLYLYDKNEQELTSGFCGKGDSWSISIKLEENTTYYILIKMGPWVTENTGNYQLTLNYKEDHTSDEMTKATSISFNQTKVESLDGTGDNDWYKFTTGAKAADYEIVFKNNNISTGGFLEQQLFVYLYDKNEQELTSSFCGKGDVCTSSIKLEENTTYYILVKTGPWITENTGNYEITVNTDAVDPGDSSSDTNSFLQGLKNFFSILGSPFVWLYNMIAKLFS